MFTCTWVGLYLDLSLFLGEMVVHVEGLCCLFSDLALDVIVMCIMNLFLGMCSVV